MPLRQPLLHDAYCRRSEERERRNPRDALSPYRDARVLHALQVAAELGCVLGQPLRPTSRTLGLLPQQALRPSSYNLRRQAALINRFISKLAVGSRRAVRARIFYSNWPLAGAPAEQLANYELVGRQVSRHSADTGERLERLVVPSCDAARILTLCGPVARRRPRSANTRR